MLKSVEEQPLGRIRSARAVARAWDAGARPDTITLNIDATLVTTHSHKELAADTYKHGYGFHPLGCSLDETGGALAAILRPGNTGANTAEEHFTVPGLALAQLPAEDLHREILVRADIGDATHAFAPTAAMPGSCSQSATSSTTRFVKRCSICPKQRGCRRSTPMAPTATAPGLPS